MSEEKYGAAEMLEMIYRFADDPENIAALSEEEIREYLIEEGIDPDGRTAELQQRLADIRASGAEGGEAVSETKPEVLAAKLREGIACLEWLADEAMREQAKRDGRTWYDWHCRVGLLRSAVWELEAWQEEVKP